MTDFATARRHMVDGQVRTADVTDLRIISAMMDIPRERFVPPASAGLAYLDLDLPVGDGSRRLLKPMVLAKLVHAADISSDDRILDVGCGTGGLLDRLTRIGFNNLVGADPFIEADGRSAEGVPLMKADLRDVDGKFDLIMFNHSLEHVPDPVETLKVAYGKLAAGGMCLARVPTTSSEAWSTSESIPLSRVQSIILFIKSAAKPRRRHSLSV